MSKLRCDIFIWRKALNIVVSQYLIILAESKSYNIELCNKAVDTVATAIQKARLNAFFISAIIYFAKRADQDAVLTKKAFLSVKLWYNGM